MPSDRTTSTPQGRRKPSSLTFSSSNAVRLDDKPARKDTGAALQLWKRLLTLVRRSTMHDQKLNLKSAWGKLSTQQPATHTPSGLVMEKRNAKRLANSPPPMKAPAQKRRRKSPPSSPTNVVALDAPNAATPVAKLPVRSPLRRTRSGLAMNVGHQVVEPPQAECQRRFNASLKALSRARSESGERALEAAVQASSAIGADVSAPDITAEFVSSMNAATSMSAADSFDLQQIDAHLFSLRSEAFIRRFRPLLVRLMEHPSNGGIFNKPVDAVALNLTDYHAVVKHPMDFGTIRVRLEGGMYTSHEDLAKDIRLVIANAQLFNPATHPVHISATRLLEEFESSFYRLTVKSESDLARKEAHSCSFCQGQACALCGDKCLKFDPPVLSCDHCGERIRRGSHFFRAPTGQRWCPKCVGSGVCFPKQKPKSTQPKVEPPTPSSDAVGAGAGTAQPAGAGAPAGLKVEATVPAPAPKPRFILRLNLARRSVQACETTAPAGAPLTPANSSIVVPRRRQKGKRSRGRSRHRSPKLRPGCPFPLERRRNDDLVAEPWVQCDGCSQWVHQICNMFNGRKRSVDDSKFYCLLCRRQTLLEEGRRSTERLLFDEDGDAAMSAENVPALHREEVADHCARTLPTTALSEELERRVHARLTAMGFGSTSQTLVIREVSSTMQETKVPSKMRNVLKLSPGVVSDEAAPVAQPPGTKVAHEYPATIPFRQRVVLMFQSIDKTDVCLFALYVQEYGPDAPPPNTNRVYVAYLDSVRYFQPLAARTPVYHEILCGYLANARRRGFSTANIWACPPQRGDGYIYHRHPQQQRTPTKDRLRKWYDTMIAQTVKEGVTVRVVSFHEQFFGKDHKLHLETGLPPVFAGDYWATEVPRGIDNLSKKLTKGKNKRSKSKAVLVSQSALVPGIATRSRLRARSPRADGGPTTPAASSPGAAGAVPVSLGAFDAAAAATSTQSQDMSPTGDGNPRLAAEHKVVSIQHTMSTRLQEANSQHIVIHFSPLADGEMEVEAEDHRISCVFFDTRHGFLRMCQGNNFQFDTLRRAKYSSQMILFLLHHPHVPAFSHQCNNCDQEIRTCLRYRCNDCYDFYLCVDCNRSSQHPHPLTEQRERFYSADGPGRAPHPTRSSSCSSFSSLGPETPSTCDSPAIADAKPESRADEE